MRPAIDLSEAFKNDDTLKRVFSWLSRIGAAPKFGSRPIAWYQIHQCHAIDILKELGINYPRVKRGMIIDRISHVSISPRELFQLADNRSRN